MYGFVDLSNLSEREILVFRVGESSIFTKLTLGKIDQILMKKSCFVDAKIEG